MPSSILRRAGARVRAGVRRAARRAVCGAVVTSVLAACGGGGDSAGTPPTEPRPPASADTFALRALATAKGIRLGTAIDRGLRTGGTAGTSFRALVARHFSSLTAENDMKHQRLQPQRGVYAWGGADSIVAFAETHGMQVRGHTLVWHQQNAAWLANGTWTADEARALLVDHVTTVATRYRGRIAAWDVVNEAFEDDGTLRNSVWQRTLGADYIALAFRTAAAADPQARLFYNDYGIEWPGRKQDSTYALVQRLLAAGVPIHGVGFQAHFQAGQLPPNFAGTLQRFAALGLDVHITELDVRVRTPSTATDRATQAQNYRDVVAACLQVSRCTSLTIWGVSDGDSWVPSTFAGWGDALPWDAALQPKPAFAALYAVLAGR